MPTANAAGAAAANGGVPPSSAPAPAAAPHNNPQHHHHASASSSAARASNAAALRHVLEHRPLRIAFVHPDLGLGGAERLVVDAAAELAARGHVVDMYTSYYDPARCFDETRTGAFSVRVAGGWFPRHVLGRLHALCAVVRCALASLYVAWRVYAGASPPYDVVIVDQVAAAVPVLKGLLQNSRVLFYCHFPDMLLTHRASLLKALYRAPLDALEQAATGSADLILVNSRFTAGVFAATFERLVGRGVAPAVLHPAVLLPEEGALAAAAAAWEGELGGELVELVRGGPTFLSINRCGRAPGGGAAVRAADARLDGMEPSSGGKLGGSVMQHAASFCHHPNQVPTQTHKSTTTQPKPTTTTNPTRFERKKGIGLALQALHELLQRKPGCAARLIVAGGYDARLAENREHLAELQLMARQLGVTDRVAFVPSFTDRCGRLSACEPCCLGAARCGCWTCCAGRLPCGVV